MNVLELVDELYESFVATLPPLLREAARDMPRRLGFAKGESARWSEVFRHDVVLGAPALFVEAMPAVAGNQVRDAVLAHALAVVDAFATDRIADGQIDADATLLAVFARARAAGEAALLRVTGERLRDDENGEMARAVVLVATLEERAILASSEGATMATYARVAAEKQRVAFGPTLCLARAAGKTERFRTAAGRALEACAVALQIYDDVIDWEEDLAAGASWPLALVRATARDASRDAREAEPHVLLASGVLASLLAWCRRAFRRAARLGAMLGASRLASWAREREDKVLALVRVESRHAGFAARAHALGPWAMEVLA